jgi:hypothetical protein
VKTIDASLVIDAAREVADEAEQFKDLLEGIDMHDHAEALIGTIAGFRAFADKLDRWSA